MICSTWSTVACSSSTARDGRRITRYHQSCHPSYHQSRHRSLTSPGLNNALPGASLSAGPPAEQMRAAILALCRAQPRTARELAAEVQCKPDHVLRYYLRPLLVQGLLERVGAASTDPNLRYRTVERGQQP